VIVEESLSGWFPRIMKVLMPSFLKNSMDQSLRILKIQAEQS
jgi:hypothetical protein